VAELREESSGSDSPTRRCPTCGRACDGSLAVCPEDRTPLAAGLGGVLLGERYRIGDRLGVGGMSAVYRATQVQLERSVAVKVARGGLFDDPAVAERFKREALAVARLKHPHVVTVYDFGVQEGVGAYLVMELLEGHSLREELTNRGRVALERAIEMMRQVCSAVHAAHTVGVIHRDLKPDNIFLERTPDGETVKVLDFGIAKVQEGLGLAALTATGTIVGTAYMSPEQCEGESLDMRSDVYSLGCVFYEMVTGHAPFAGSSFVSMMTKHIAEPPRPLRVWDPEVPSWLETALLRALAKNPTERFQTAAELGAAVAAFSGDVSLQVTLDLNAPTTPAAQWGAHPRMAPNNLPKPVTPFVGRAREVAELRQIFEQSRLVTITGAGGVGKTRLALKVAEEALGRFPEGVWFVDLAALAEGREMSLDRAVAFGLAG
jgi:serine/threonine protein kinase